MKKTLSLLLSILMLLSITAGMSFNANAASTWEYESNDNPNTANSFAVGQTIKGYLPASDIDCFVMSFNKSMVFQVVFDHDVDYDKACAWTLSVYKYNSTNKTWYDYYHTSSKFEPNSWYYYDKIYASDGISFSDPISVRAGDKYLFVVRTGGYGGSEQGQVQYQASLREYLSGWQTIGGKKYYYKDNAPLKGLNRISGKYYIFNKSTGEMCTGEVRCNGKYYIMSKSTGEMCYGKVRCNGKYYIMSKSNGQMLFGKVTCDGYTYICSKSDGHIFMNQYVTCNGVRYYCNSYGVATRK